MSKLLRVAFIAASFLSHHVSVADARSAAKSAAVPRAFTKRKTRRETKLRGGATSADPPKWLEICGKLAPATSVLCSLAPLPTIIDAAKAQSVGSLPLLPYSSMAANGFIWSLYGWLAESPPVLGANIAGTVLGLYYCKEYRKCSPPGASGLPGTIHQHALVVTWIALANAFIVSRLPRKVSTDFVGKEGVLFYILLFASPLVAAKNVIATKSAASIALPFTIASLINCSLWSAVGLLLMNDFYIWFPCVMGLLSALAQLFLKGIYGDGAPAASVLQEMGNLHVHAT
ncbi:hypothetical protein ACHAXT_012329 [Thalassiosira profunda]